MFQIFDPSLKKKKKKKKSPFDIDGALSQTAEDGAVGDGEKENQEPAGEGDIDGRKCNIFNNVVQLMAILWKQRDYNDLLKSYALLFHCRW